MSWSNIITFQETSLKAKNPLWWVYHHLPWRWQYVLELLFRKTK